MRRHPYAVLWDFDGTLLDTEPIWIGVEQDVVTARGGAWSWEQGVELCGTASAITSAALIAAIGDDTIDPVQLSRECAQLVAQRIAEQELRWRPGAKELLTELNAADIPCALVSASPSSVLAAGLDRIGDRFAVIIDGHQATRPKPAPDPYHLAAGHIGVAARDCVVIDDSAAGTEAGRRSGAAVIAVPCMKPLDEFPGQLNLPNLNGVDLARLGEIWDELTRETR